MTTQYTNAPLVEVVAELRWETTPEILMRQSPGSASIEIPPTAIRDAEEQYKRFMRALEPQGFRSSERLTPAGTPLLPGEPAIRLRHEFDVPPLVQMGMGVFTANGLPPTYTNWDAFRTDTLHPGISALLHSRTEPDAPFSRLSLRYINAFGAQFLNDRTSGEFISNVLGFNLNLPEPLTLRTQEHPTNAAHQVQTMTQDGTDVVLSVGEGESDGAKVVLLDILVGNQNIPNDENIIREMFEKNHELISDIFRSITTNVQDILTPIEEA